MDTYSEETHKQLISPYVPWPTFLNFVDRLKATVVPPRIDSGVMMSFSGAMRSQLLVALKFLRLIDSNETTTELLKKLISAYQSEDWKTVLGEIVTQAYDPIIQGLDIKSATSMQLAERFRDIGGVTGSTVDKCIRFYLGALKEADITFSPHFVARRGRTSGSGKGENSNGRAKRNSRKSTREKSSPEPEQPPSSSGPFAHGIIPQPPGTTTLPVPIPGKPMVTIVFPDDLNEDEWAMIDQYFRNYVKLRNKAENAETQPEE